MPLFETHSAPEEFVPCWLAAARHIEAGLDRVNWLKADPDPPYFEHFSFRLGNQLFFVRIEIEGADFEAPGLALQLLQIAEGCKGHACLMPMTRRRGKWQALEPRWGPPECRDQGADQPARARHRRAHRDDGLGATVTRRQSCPAFDPSIWFEGATGPEWVVVRAARYPA